MTEWFLSDPSALIVTLSVMAVLPKEYRCHQAVSLVLYQMLVLELSPEVEKILAFSLVLVPYQRSVSELLLVCA